LERLVTLVLLAKWQNHSEQQVTYMKCFLLSVVDAYQNQMEASYQEKSMLTNLFTENKFWGWTGLTAIAISIGIILWSFYPNDEKQE